MTHNFNLLY